MDKVSVGNTMLFHPPLLPKTGNILSFKAKTYINNKEIEKFGIELVLSKTLLLKRLIYKGIIIAYNENKATDSIGTNY